MVYVIMYVTVYVTQDNHHPLHTDVVRYQITSHMYIICRKYILIYTNSPPMQFTPYSKKKLSIQILTPDITTLGRIQDWYIQPSVMSLENNFISWTWLGVNLCCRLRSGDSLIRLVGFYLNFSVLYFSWRVKT